MFLPGKFNLGISHRCCRMTNSQDKRQQLRQEQECKSDPCVQSPRIHFPRVTSLPLKVMGCYHQNIKKYLLWYLPPHHGAPSAPLLSLFLPFTEDLRGKPREMVFLLCNSTPLVFSAVKQQSCQQLKLF